MAVRAEPMPPPATMLGIVDVEAREAMKDAQGELRRIVDVFTPKETGLLAKSMKPRLGRTQTGASLTVGPSRAAKHGDASMSQVLRWITRGTGEYREGPGPKRRIRAKNPLRRMILPGGKKVRSVRGQKPNPFFLVIESQGTTAVEAASRARAELAARKAQRIA